MPIERECILNYWPQWFRERMGCLPRTFCVIDIETTGFHLDRDVIWQYGHLLVSDGKITSHSSIVLDWTEHKIVALHWLKNAVEVLRQHMEFNGRSSHLTLDRMREEGRKPEDGLAFMRDHLALVKENGIPFVLHGGGFDERMLSANFLGFGIAKGFSFGDEGYFDTECIEKASQLISNERVHPKRKDTLRDYFHRVRYTKAAGIKSNLDGWCYQKYELEKLGIDKRAMHDATVDVMATYHVFEAQRAQIQTAPVDAPIYPSADVKESRKTRSTSTPPLPMGPRVPQPRRRGQRNS